MKDEGRRGEEILEEVKGVFIPEKHEPRSICRSVISD